MKKLFIIVTVAFAITSCNSKSLDNRTSKEINDSIEIQNTLDSVDNTINETNQDLRSIQKYLDSLSKGKTKK